MQSRLTLHARPAPGSNTLGVCTGAHRGLSTRSLTQAAPRRKGLCVTCACRSPGRATTAAPAQVEGSHAAGVSVLARPTQVAVSGTHNRGGLPCGQKLSPRAPHAGRRHDRWPGGQPSDMHRGLSPGPDVPAALPRGGRTRAIVRGSVGRPARLAGGPLRQPRLRGALREETCFIGPARAMLQSMWSHCEA